jgi:hypothetical protein
MDDEMGKKKSLAELTHMEIKGFILFMQYNLYMACK